LALSAQRGTRLGGSTSGEFVHAKCEAEVLHGSVEDHPSK
jgi:hypothetical protein